MTREISGTCSITLIHDEENQSTEGTVKRALDYSADDFMSLHTLVGKYDLEILKVHLLWLYKNFQAQSPSIFLALFNDANEKGLCDVATAASETNISEMKASEVSQYPLWYMKKILGKRNECTTIVADILKKATEEKDTVFKNTIRRLLSKKSQAFKADVL